MALELPQTTFPDYHDPAVAGHLSTYYTGRKLESKFATVATGPGLGVCFSATSTQLVALPTAAADVTNLTCGIVVHEPWRVFANAYGQNRWITVCRSGRIWVQVAGAALLESAPNAVFMIHSGADAGKFRGSAGAGPDATAFPTAKVVRAGQPGGIAMIEINLP